MNIHISIMYFVSMYIYFIFAFKRVETISNSNIDKLKLVGHPALVVIKLLSMSLYSYLKNQSSITLFLIEQFCCAGAKIRTPK